MHPKVLLAVLVMGLVGLGLFAFTGTGATRTEAAGSPASIQFLSSSLVDCTTGSGVVSVLVTDSLGSPVDDGTLVSFSIDVGSITPLAATTSGIASAAFSSTSLPGFATITVTAGGVAAQTLVFPACGFVGTTQAVGPFTVTTSTVCGTHTATVTVTITDAFGNPVPDGTPVDFSVTPGSITPSATTVNGSASATYTPGPNMQGSASLTVIIDNQFVEGLPIDCGPNGGPPALLSIHIPQSSVTCGSQASIFAAAGDIFGNQVHDGTTISFAALGGTIIPAAPTSGGNALSVFTATPLSTGTAQITAQFVDVSTTVFLPVTCAVTS